MARKEERMMLGKILVPINRTTQIEKIIPDIERVSKPGMKSDRGTLSVPRRGKMNGRV